MPNSGKVQQNMEKTYVNYTPVLDDAASVIKEVHFIFPGGMDYVPQWVTEELSSNPYFGLC